MSEKEKLSTTLEETSSSTQENLEEKSASELHETYVSFGDYSTDESSDIDPSTPPSLPPRLLKPQISIRLGLYTKVKSHTWDRYSTMTTLTKDEPNSPRSSKSISFSRLKSLFHPDKAASSSTSTTTSDHDHDHDEMFDLRERIAAGETLVETQRQEIATLREEVAETRKMLQELRAQMEQFAETRIMLQELRAQMEQFAESQAPVPPHVAASCDLVDLLSF
ncbi:hypothetical protein C1H46_014998 [Malus baccata]|uniref:Uncharacterized protein n=1 Tax=Malus baccata TaxID=106549 RepID=A0A540MKW2_MALBA|nr:hypothetical protein C1H46_014998 [Malus baccata]